MADKKIYYLHDLDDYKVDSDYNDVRGWPLLDRNGSKVGEVDNLIVNKDSKRVVYLDVATDDDYMKGRSEAFSQSSGKDIHTFVSKDGEDHLIVPIGMVAVDGDNKRVLCDKIDPDKFRQVKRHQKNEALTPAYEVEVMNVYTNGSGNIVAIDDTFYSRPEFGGRR